MILFVVEGAKTEPKIYETIKELYFREEEDIIYIFNSNIYVFYNRLQQYASDFAGIDNSADVVAVLREMYPEQLRSVGVSSDIDQIFLFFDYDFQHVFHILEKNPDSTLDDVLRENNQRLERLLGFFNDETGMGKLYINYPMTEALKYTKSLPDKNYYSYTTTLDECHGRFKGKAETFSAYKAYRGILLDGVIDVETVRDNWEMLKRQNAMKANYVCESSYTMPRDKNRIEQARIFRHQMKNYAGSKELSVLCSFPLFLYDYFR